MPIQSYEDVPFFSPKWPICPEQCFFGTNHYYYLHLPISLPIGLFHCTKFKKTSHRRSRVMKICQFRTKYGPFSQTIFFGGKIVIIFIYLLAPFIVPNLLKSLTADPPFFVPKLATSPNDKYFRKPVNEPCYFHSCLYACQKSKSDINLLMKH